MKLRTAYLIVTIALLTGVLYANHAAAVIISDCLPGFHHPSTGDLASCVPDVPPPAPQTVPALSAIGYVNLELLLIGTGLIVLWRRRA